MDHAPPPQPWRTRLHEISFEADTPVGRASGACLLPAIGLSVIRVCLERVASIPRTVSGGLLASKVPVMGRGTLAAPSGIVTIALGRACPGGGAGGHDGEAQQCRRRGAVS
jgi:hypothetical protein